MQFASACWEGTFVSEDGALAQFSLSQPGLNGWSAAEAGGSVTEQGTMAITIQGGVRTAMRLLEGAKSVVVALAESVPDPISGRCGQLLVDARIRGDRMVGQWLRRDVNGVVQSMGRLTAVRKG